MQVETMQGENNEEQSSSNTASIDISHLFDCCIRCSASRSMDLFCLYDHRSSVSRLSFVEAEQIGAMT
jgi:hypothetical protein